MKVVELSLVRFFVRRFNRDFSPGKAGKKMVNIDDFIVSEIKFGVMICM
jgi:hypothetical protein